VGDGPDVLAFSILVQGLRGRHSLGAVRGAQVSCVNAMMRYVREAQGHTVPGEQPGFTPAIDIESGQEVSETEGEAIEPEGASAEDPVDAVIKKDLKERAAAEGAAVPASEKEPLKAPAACCKAATPAGEKR
jgi:hypothetical protein